MGKESGFTPEQGKNTKPEMDEGLRELLEGSPKGDNKNFISGKIEIPGRGEFPAYETHSKGTSVDTALLGSINAYMHKDHKMPLVLFRTISGSNYEIAQSTDDGKWRLRKFGSPAPAVGLTNLPKITVGETADYSREGDSSPFQSTTDVVQITVVDTAKNIEADQSAESSRGETLFDRSEERRRALLNKVPTADDRFRKVTYESVRSDGVRLDHPAYEVGLLDVGLGEDRAVEVDLEDLREMNSYMREENNFSLVYLTTSSGNIYELEEKYDLRSGTRAPWGLRDYKPNSKREFFAGKLPKITLGKSLICSTEKCEKIGEYETSFVLPARTSRVDNIVVVNPRLHVKKGEETTDIGERFRKGPLPPYQP